MLKCNSSERLPQRHLPVCSGQTTRAAAGNRDAVCSLTWPWPQNAPAHHGRYTQLFPEFLWRKFPEELSLKALHHTSAEGWTRGSTRGPGPCPRRTQQWTRQQGCPPDCPPRTHRAHHPEEQLLSERARARPTPEIAVLESSKCYPEGTLPKHKSGSLGPISHPYSRQIPIFPQKQGEWSHKKSFFKVPKFIYHMEFVRESPIHPVSCYLS
nr:uncharacterized protein LOC112927731 [Vulpes vulpes]